jgi:hypothetical protein
MKYLSKDQYDSTCTATVSDADADGRVSFYWFICPPGMSADLAYATQPLNGPFMTAKEARDDRIAAMLGGSAVKAGFGK